MTGSGGQATLMLADNSLVAVGEETRYVGDAIALVAARSRKIAREALALIKVDYEELSR